MALFKRAAVRGIAHELVRSGLCSFPSKYAMDASADMVADAAPPEMPEVTPEEGHDPEQVAMVANKLIEIAHELMAHAGAGGPAGAAEVAKTSSAQDYDSVAYTAAVECMDKAASEVKQGGALMHGGDAQNTPSDAAKTDEMAALDAQQRPQGKHVVGVGNTALSTAAGEIGSQSSHSESPSNSPSGTNSLHKAAYEAVIRKHAQALMKGGDKQNTPAAAAQHNDVAALDLSRRPQGKYLVGQGNANIDVSQDAHIGREHPATEPPKNKATGSNSVIQASKVAGLNQEEQAYLELFSKTAADVGSFLPKSLSEDEKVAALQRMIPMNHVARQAELDKLYKFASSLPEALAEIKEEKKDDSKKEKSESADAPAESSAEEKKESSLLERIRNVAATAR